MSHFPEIIQAAATSPLGIVALAILIVALMARAFFVKSNTAAKKWSYVTMVAAVVTLAISVVLVDEKKEDETASSPGTKIIQNGDGNVQADTISNSDITTSSD